MRITDLENKSLPAKGVGVNTLSRKQGCFGSIRGANHRSEKTVREEQKF